MLLVIFESHKNIDSKGVFYSSIELTFNKLIRRVNFFIMSNNYDEVWKKEKVIKLTNSITDLMGKKTLSSMIARIDKMSQHEIETYPLLEHTENDDVEHVQDMLFNIFLTEDNNNDNKFDKIQSFTESQLPFL